MGLLSCPECDGQVSDRAGSCPHCGYPIQEDIENATSVDAEDMVEDAEAVPDSARPSSWGPSLYELAEMHRAAPFPHGVDPSSLSEAEMDAIGDYVGAALALREFNRAYVDAQRESGDRAVQLDHDKTHGGWFNRIKAHAKDWVNRTDDLGEISSHIEMRRAVNERLAEMATQLQAASTRQTPATLDLPTTGLRKVLKVYGLPIWGLLGETYPALADFCADQ